MGCATGDEDIPGLTDEMKPRSRGPKRASKIRKLYNLSKEDDVRSAAKMHGITKEKNGKTYISTVKIQRLITPASLQRKRRRSALKKTAFAKVCMPFS
jgi:small subunit ribosomal protein S6e